MGVYMKLQLQYHNKNNSIEHKSFAIKDPATFSPRKIPENLGGNVSV